MNNIQSQIEQVVNQIKGQVSNLSPVLEVVSALVESSIVNNFDRGGNPSWIPLAKSTIRAYTKKKYSLKPTLDRKGHLRDSIEVRPYGKSGIMVSANSEYAAIHQFGGVIKHPGGTAYVSVGPGQSAFISNKKAAKLESQGHNILRTRAHSITIPARPFVSLSDDDLNEIKQILQDYILSL